MATTLIIYYKQISEGYDDRERYQIMQKVGMSKKEVRQSIRSQVLLVFFLPLIMAVIHLAFAFKIITKLAQRVKPYEYIIIFHVYSRNSSGICSNLCDNLQYNSKRILQNTNLLRTQTPL